jgi:hypothetical protein
MGYGLRFATARDLFAAFPAAFQDMKIGPSDLPSIDHCRALMASRIPEDAITFCAYLLSNRAAIWWGHECVSNLPLDDQDWHMLSLARAWVSEPKEFRRYAAMDEAMSCTARTPAVWIALAAGWDTETLARHGGDQPAVSNPYLTARAVNTGVLGGLARVSQNDRATVLRDFVDMGLELARSEASQAAAAGH